MSSRGRLRGSIAMCAAAVLIAPPLSKAATHTFTIPASEQPFVTAHGSNGFRIDLSGANGDVDLSATARGTSADYTVAGVASMSQIKASFGKLGRVSLVFQASGPPTAVPPPKNCSGEDEMRTPGVYRGVLRFRGEGGYTRVSKTALRGTYIKTPQLTCTETSQHHHGYKPLVFSAQRLRRGRITDLTAYQVPAQLSPDHRAGSLIDVFDFHFRGPMQISRTALVFGGAAAFSHNRAQTSATLTPPHPFEGAAHYDAARAPALRLRGDLEASLPGSDPIHLTGRGFEAGFSHGATIFAVGTGTSRLSQSQRLDPSLGLMVRRQR